MKVPSFLQKPLAIAAAALGMGSTTGCHVRAYTTDYTPRVVYVEAAPPPPAALCVDPYYGTVYNCRQDFYLYAGRQLAGPAPAHFHYHGNHGYVAPSYTVPSHDHRRVEPRHQRAEPTIRRASPGHRVRRPRP